MFGRNISEIFSRYPNTFRAEEKVRVLLSILFELGQKMFSPFAYTGKVISSEMEKNTF